MKKTLIVLIAFVVVALAWISLYKGEVVPVPVVIPPATSSATTTSITVDYSKLEKDTIYTEEEGKYENLPPEGKKLLEQLVGMPECVTNPSGVYCKENKLVINESAILAVKNGVLLYGFPTQGGAVHFTLYDLGRNAPITEPLSMPSIRIRNNKILVFRDHSTRGGLLYYKPGLSSFRTIPGASSRLIKSEEFYGTDGSDWTGVSGSIKGNTLIVPVSSTYNPETNTYKKVRDEIFDLSTLP